MKKEYTDFGARMKAYEKEYEMEISTNEFITVRIDGHKFSKYTKGFKRPFDDILSKAMEATTKDLVEEFQAVVGYTQSDEITLIIPSPKSKKEHYNKKDKQDSNHIYNGRVQKIASLCAGFATMVFNRHLVEKITFAQEYLAEVCLEVNPKDAIERLEYLEILENKKGKAWFDARAWAVPNEIEAFNAVLWRVHDCVKNAKSMFAQSYCSHKSLHGKSGDDQVYFCEYTTGNKWSDVEDRYKYGILVKKEKYIKAQGWDDFEVNPRFQQNDAVERSRVISYTELLTFSDENVEKLLSKFI